MNKRSRAGAGVVTAVCLSVAAGATASTQHSSGVSEDRPLPVPLRSAVCPLPVPLSRNPVGDGLQLPPFAVRETAMTTHASGTFDGKYLYDSSTRSPRRLDQQLGATVISGVSGFRRTRNRARSCGP